ncbi:MAG: hypothetical protein DYG94_10290 [Leptolyngbya sp. PLA3]|nr:MAG: hypothetical protein EDM82_09705 [Cyanobacteria bacterium CYA]MCE7969119.1 hypothetical protein [Leptolyngbya sp. PL-A3]
MKTSILGIVGLVGLAGSIASADVVIEFTGMNLVYDGSSLYDAGSAAGGSADPADADGLASADFFLNGLQVGALSSDISLDVYVPNLVGIPSTAGTSTIINTGGAGFFDLLIGTSPLASQFLLVDVSSVAITYIDVAGILQFTFGGAVADSFAQNLPYGLMVGNPLTVSFSAQIDQGTLTSDGGFITGFRASGTGEFRGEAVPTPGSIALVALGVPAVIRRRR